MTSVQQRDSFFGELYRLARKDPNIVVITADMGSKVLNLFRKEMPSQLINVGIAEQNAISLASGLSLVGKKVFVYAISSFITLRCLEQIKVSCGIMNIPITIVGIGTGLSYNSDGPTHHLIEDISIMRSLPNIEIDNITDNSMAMAFARISCDITHPNYIRLDKDIYPDIYEPDFDFILGLSKIKEGTENIIIVNSPMVNISKEIAETLPYDIGVIDVFRLPINDKLLISMLKNVKKIISVEEHFLPGGLGSAVCEVLNDNKFLIPVKRLGLDINSAYKYCYKYGGREIIRRFHKLDRKNLTKTIKEYFKN